MMHPASLRFRLGLLVLLSMLPALLLATYDAWDRYRHETDLAQERALDVARAVSAEHDDLVAGAHQLLVALTELPQVRQLDAVGCSRFFGHLMTKYVQYANLGAATPAGDVFCSAVPVPGAVNIADRSWFHDVVRTRQFVVGEYVVGRVTGRPSVLFALPVTDPGGTVRAVAFASLDLGWLNRRMQAAPLPPDASVTVVDRNGRVLARHPDPERWLGQQLPDAVVQTIHARRGGATKGLGLDGVPQLYAFTPFGRGTDSGASVTVAIPSAHVAAGVGTRFARHVLGLGFAAAALLIVAGVGGQIVLLRPIRALVDATRKLARGEAAVRTGLGTAAGELGELARHFDAMAEALDERGRARDRVEAALRESEAQYRALVESSSDAILLTVPDGQILAANAAACQLFGMTETELCAAGRAGVVDPADPRLAPGLAVRARTGRVTAELRFRRKDGSTFEGEISSAVFQDRSGALRTSMIIRDVTERKQMEEDLRSGARHLRDTVETLQLRTSQLEAVRDITVEITHELDLTMLLELITQRAVELGTASGGLTYLWDTARQVLVPRAWHGAGDAPVGALRCGVGEGLAGAVAQLRRGLMANEFRTSAYATPVFLEHTRYVAVLAEPLLYRDEVVGVLAIAREDAGRPFTGETQDLLRLFATQAAIAIENARLFAAAEAAARKAQSLYEVAHSVTTSVGVAEVLRLIAAKTTVLLGTPHAQVVLWDDATQCLRLGAACGTEASTVQTQTFRLGAGVNGVVAQTRTPLIVNDYPAFPHRVPDMPGLVAAIGVPLLYRQRLLGVLTSHATAPGSTFTDEDLALLASFADQAAVAIENARLYEALRMAAAELETRVADRTRDLADANRKLETVSHHKSAFLANMSHELRTPLNSILGFAQLLLEQTTGVLSAKQRRFLTHIYNSGHHLLQLISDILDLNKVEAGKLTLHPEPVALPTIVQETLAIVRGLAEQKELSVEVTVPDDLPRLMADPVRLKQILFNLLSNAVKFTPERGRIAVEVRQVGTAPRDSDASPGGGPEAGTPSDPAEEWLEVRVADTGAGIRAEDLPRLFHNFVQLDATATKHHEGTGLGLALTKHLVELHGGRIWAESAGLGRGACFVVQLPLLEVPVSRILVVDDEAPLRRLLAMILREAGYSVEVAADAPEAIRAIAAAPPALVVLDVGLPPDGAGGWMVLAHLRGTEGLRQLPVLVLTGNDQIRAEEALARGADEFLGKPVSPHVLSETVGRLLRRGQPPDAEPGSPADAGAAR